MPVVCFSEEHFSFPPVSKADDEGLLVIGGKVTPDRVLEAYPKGIFPWYSEDEIPLWWSPDPRFVLFPKELHCSRSMQKLLRKSDFEFRTNSAFEAVIDACASSVRPGQEGTWITAAIREAYTDLHRRGFAHSAETWYEGALVGGVYGVRLGRVFFGESMFSHKTNASKFAFLHYVRQLEQEGVRLVDCQVYTPHVESLGARSIERTDFLQLLKNYCQEAAKSA